MKFTWALLVLAMALGCTSCEVAGGGALEAGAAEAAAEGAVAAGAEIGAEAGLVRGMRAGGMVESGLRGAARTGPVESSGWTRFSEGPRGSAVESSARPRASVPRSVEPFESRGQLNSFTVRMRGAQPFDGVTRHYEYEGGSYRYRGYSVHTREVSTHYDEAGRLDGRTEHRADGSIAYDARGQYKGKSFNSERVTKVYDASGKYKGFNNRFGTKIYFYDEHGNYTGYSTIEASQSASAHMPIAVIPLSNDCVNWPATGACRPIGSR